MSDIKKTILWVEDNAQEELCEFIYETIEEQGMDLEIASGTSALCAKLQELKKQKRNVDGVILDIILDGAESLADFGYETVSLTGSVNAGCYLIKYVFRSDKENSKYKYLNKVPILVLTVKSNITEKTLEKYTIKGKKVQLVHKFGKNDQGWENKVKQWIKERK